MISSILEKYPLRSCISVEKFLTVIFPLIYDSNFSPNIYRSVGPQVEGQIGPIVDSEIQRWIPEDEEGTTEREVVLRIQDQIHETSPEFWSSEGNEVVKMELGPTVTEGPIFRQHVEVETNLAVETSPKVLKR